MTDFEIEILLQKTIGLKVTSIGKVTLDRSVQRRMKALSLDKKEDYVKKLKASILELKELIEEVVIPETWFFRDREPFKVLIKYLVSRWAPRHKNGLCKVLSAPCSTGEEPYSLAMSLLSSGWPAEKFTVHAVDISQRSLSRAKEGIYSKHSFRDPDLGYRTRYFQQRQNCYLLNKNVRDKVLFQYGNVLNKSFMEGLGMFDVIFFRNVLIYFDGLSRHQAIAILYKMLADDGILFVGHAEANLFNNSPFTPAPFQQAFAFYKKSKQQLKTEAKDDVVPEQGRLKTNISSHAQYLLHLRKKTRKPLPDLQLARKLADKGALQQATAICEDYLDQCGPSAQAFFLLGIIRDSADDAEQAEKLFRKALYLDPNNEEILVFLLLLAEKTGDARKAMVLKQRIERLRGKTETRHQES